MPSFGARRGRRALRVALELVELRVDELLLEDGTTIRLDDDERAADDQRAARARAARGSRRGTAHRVAEAVADAAHREDQLRLARVALDLLAQVTDVDVDRPRLAVVGAAPEPLEQRAGARTRRPGSPRAAASSSNST